jgi:penicillin-binding protein-related factor A (putative recombinase)
MAIYDNRKMPVPDVIINVSESFARVRELYFSKHSQTSYTSPYHIMYILYRLRYAKQGKYIPFIAIPAEGMTIPIVNI